jgi:hypothetical protein
MEMESSRRMAEGSRGHCGSSAGAGFMSEVISGLGRYLIRSDFNRIVFLHVTFRFTRAVV